MFEKIVLRRSENGAALTAGGLAEALLFYQHVHLVLDEGSIRGLLQSLGAPTLLSILNRPNVSATHCPEMLAVHSTNGVFKAHTFVAFRIAGSKESGPIKSKREQFEVMTVREGLTPPEAKRFSKRFFDVVETKSLESGHFIEGGVIAAAREEIILDDRFVQEAVRRIYCDLSGETAPPPDLYFKIQSDDKGLYVFTNIDFDRLTKRVQAKRPDAGAITDSWILSDILNACSDAILAGHYW